MRFKIKPNRIFGFVFFWFSNHDELQLNAIYMLVEDRMQATLLPADISKWTFRIFLDEEFRKIQIQNLKFSGQDMIGR